MRKPVVALFAACALSAQQPAPERTDTVLRAMTDEIGRTKALAIGDRAYFVEYQMEDADIFNVSASLGALLSVGRNRFRLPRIEVRAGDYDFDNTNYVGSGSRGNLGGRLPTDDHYSVLRKYLWLGTDRVYKSALESLSRKRATLRNQTASATKLADFSRLEPTRLVLPVGKLSIDEKTWTARVKSLSAIFRQYPVANDSSVEVVANYGTSYYVNTEGSVQRTPDSLYEVRIRAQANAPDGAVVKSASFSLAVDPSALPSDADLQAEVKRVAGNVKDLAPARSARATRDPCCLSRAPPRSCSRRLLAIMCAPVAAPSPTPAARYRICRESSRQRSDRAFCRIGWTWGTTPRRRNSAARSSLGSMWWTAKACRRTPVALVEKGVLRSFLTTRQPVANAAESNGHARLPGNFGAHSPAIGNLFVMASQSKPLGELKAQLIGACKERGKPYGLIVRELDFPSSMSFAELQQFASSNQSGSRPLSPPVLIYRVYPDGREELVRGLRFRGFSSRSLRDILAASSESAVFQYLNNGAPFALSGIGGIVAPTAVIAPAVLFDELELDRPQEGLSKPPTVPPPPIE